MNISRNVLLNHLYPYSKKKIIKKEGFDSCFRKGGWMVKSVYPLYKDYSVGKNVLEEEWLGRQPEPRFAWKEQKLYTYVKKNKVVSTQYTLLKSDYSYKEDACELNIDNTHSFFRTQIVLSINDSLYVFIYRLVIPLSLLTILLVTVMSIKIVQPTMLNFGKGNGII